MNKIGVRRRLGFAIVPSTIFEDESLDALAKMVYVALCKFANQERVAYPSIATIAKMCSCSNASVKRKLSTLIKQGYVEKVERYDKDTKKQQSNLYVVNDIPFNNVDNSKDIVENYVEKPVENSTGGSQRTAPKLTVNPTLAHSEPHPSSQRATNNTNITIPYEQYIYTGDKSPKVEVPIPEKMKVRR